VNQGRPSTELDDILAICLDNLLRGEKTLAECLRDYPQYADELKPALQVAFLTMRLKPAEMPAKGVDALEMRLRAQMGGSSRPSVIPVNTVFGLSRLAAVILITFFLALGSGAGLVAASADDLPGDPLYGIKRLWETIVLTFAPLTGGHEDLWLRIAETRLDEVNRLAEGGRLTDAALADLYSASYYVTFYGGDASRLIAYFNRAYLTLFNRIQPPGEAVLYREVVDAVNPVNRIAADGSVIPLDDPLPPSLRSEQAQILLTPSATYTMTATNTPSPQPSATPSPTDTASPVPTATDTPTPRIPPTPSRTPTLPPTRVPSLTPVPSVTATWTPLPLPNGQPAISPAATAVPPGLVPNSTTVVLPTQDLAATERVRATDQAVYITQTYEAQQNGTSEPE
jgi:hypothetical protein